MKRKGGGINVCYAFTWTWRYRSLSVWILLKLYSYRYISRSVWHCIIVASITDTITARLDYSTYNLIDVYDVVVSHVSVTSLVNYAQATRIESRLRPASSCSAFQSSERTNNDVEGWPNWRNRQTPQQKTACVSAGAGVVPGGAIHLPPNRAGARRLSSPISAPKAWWKQWVLRRRRKVW